jgi:hypothetical protein
LELLDVFQQIFETAGATQTRSSHYAQVSPAFLRSRQRPNFDGRTFVQVLQVSLCKALPLVPPW